MGEIPCRAFLRWSKPISRVSMGNSLQGAGACHLPADPSQGRGDPCGPALTLLVPPFGKLAAPACPCSEAVPGLLCPPYARHGQPPSTWCTAYKSGRCTAPSALPQLARPPAGNSRLCRSDQLPLRAPVCVQVEVHTCVKPHTAANRPKGLLHVNQVCCSAHAPSDRRTWAPKATEMQHGPADKALACG